MKKIKRSAAVVATTLLLVGCGDASASISNGEDVLFTINDVNITNNDIYEGLANQSGANTTVTMMQQEIMDRVVPVNEEMEEKAQQKLAETKESAKDSFEQTLKQYGFADETEYVEKAILPSIQQEAMIKAYVDEDYQTLVKEYQPVKAEILQFTSSEDAEAALAEVKDGQSMQQAGLAHNTSSKYQGTETLYTKSSALPDSVMKALTENEVTQSSLKDTVVTATNENGATSYFVLLIVSNQAEDLKDEAMTNFLEIQEVKTGAATYYFKKYDFKVHDLKLHEAIKELNKDLVK